MRVDRLRVFGSLAAALLLLLFLSIINQGFTVFEYAPLEVEQRLVPVGEDVGQEVSRVLWRNRQMDLIVLAFLLFTAGSCCSCILRHERGGEG